MKTGIFKSRMIGGRRVSREGLLAAAALTLIIAALAGFSFLGRQGATTCWNVCLTVESPLNEAPVLDPVVVRVQGEAARRSSGAVIRFSPAVEGETRWEGDDRLVFRPAWPGFARGVTYQGAVRVPGGTEGSSAKATFTLTTAGRLAVQAVFPEPGSVEVPEDAALFVQFNRSVAPLGDVRESGPGDVLRFEPPVEGEGRWLNTSLYSFQPKDGWQPATLYTVTVRKGLTNLLDGVLQDDYVWSFTTIMPAVAEVSPADMTQFVASDGIRVVFNQPVEHADAEAAFELRDEDGVAVEGRFEWPDERTLVFRPEAALRPGTTFRATVRAGVHALGREATTSDDYSWRFVSVGVPRVVASDPPDGASGTRRWGVRIMFSSPMDPKSTENEITLDPAPEGDRGMAVYWEQSGLTAHVTANLKPSTAYVLRVAGGADRYGTPLAEPYEARFTTAPLEPGFSVYRPGRSGTFDAYLSPVVFARSWNVARLDFSLYRVDRDTLMLMETASDFLTKYEPPANSLIRRWSIDIPDPPLDQPVSSRSPLAEGGGLLDPGYYLLDLSAPGAREHDRLPIVVSRTHATLKLADGEALAWLVDMQTGDPIAGATVELVNPGHPPLTSGTTGPDGTAVLSFQMPETTFTQTVFLSAARAGDAVLVSSGWSNGIDVWDFRLPSGYWERRELVGNLETDRPIYRPGETVYYRGVIRTDDDARYGLPPADPGVMITVRDSRGNVVKTEGVRLDEYGVFSGELALSADAPTGAYSLSLQRKPRPAGVGTDWVAYGSFQVAEFRRPDFQVTVLPDKPVYFNGETARVRAQASFYFGAPVADADVLWDVRTEDYAIALEKYPGYSFSDMDRWDRRDWLRVPTRLLTTGNGRTDADGNFEFTVPADVSGEPISQKYTLEAVVTDANKQQVASDVQVVVHQGRFYVGLRPQSFVHAAGSPVTLDLVTLDPDATPVPDVPLRVLVYKRKWLVVREQDAEGDQLYRSEPEDTLVETMDARTGADGEGAVAFTPAQSGEYRVVAEGTDEAGNTVRAGISLYATGGEYAAWRVENNDRIELVADKDRYRPGDVARVLVASPVDGARGLVTVERGRILDRAIRDFPTNSTTLEITIEDRFVPDVFVSVVLFKPPTAANPLPSVKFGYVQLKVDNDNRRLRIKIESDRDTYAPGDLATYRITTTDASGRGVPAEMSLALVDKAIRALAVDRTEPGIQAFWSERGLAVRMGDSFAASIDRANELAIDRSGPGGKGGGGGEQDALRRNFVNTAYWNPAFRTDAAGEGAVTVKLPDTLTTWHLTVRAITQDTLTGDEDHEVVARKPLMLRPALPRFLVVGDRAQVQTMVHNQTNQDATVRVALSVQGVALESDAAQSLLVPAGGTGRTSWEITVPPGDRAVFRFDAEADTGPADSVETSLPVHDYVTPETTGTAGQVLDEAAEAIVVPAYARDDRGELTVRVDPSVADGMGGPLDYLREYPYESAEDTVNRFLPRLVLRRTVDELHLRDAPDPGADIAPLVERSLQRLYSAQHTDGGWGWFVEDSSDPIITAYVLIGLGEAQRSRFTVDGGAIARASAYLTGEMSHYYDVAHPLSPDRRAYMLYGLASAGMGDPARVLSLAEQPGTLGNAGKAWALLALVEMNYTLADPRAQSLVTGLAKAAIVSAAGAHWEEERYDPALMVTSTTTTAVALQALAAAVPEHPLLDGAVRWLLAGRKDSSWSSTRETSASLLALTQVLRSRTEAQGEYDYAVGLNGEERLAGHAEAGRLNQGQTLTVAVGDLLRDAANELVLRRTSADGAGKLYYSAYLRYWTPAERVEAADHGLGVSHEYFPADGDQPALNAMLGDVVRVKVTLVAPADLNYVLLEDFLPAGLEPIDASLKVTPQDVRDRMAEEAAKSRRALSARYDPRCGGGFRCGYWAYSPFSHVDVRDDRVALFARFVPRGTYEYTYFARATTAGRFRVLPAQAAERYFPDVWGRSDGDVFEVRSEVEAETLAPQRDDVAAGAAGSRQPLADSPHQGVEGFFGDADDMGAGPDMGHKLIPGADLAPIAEEVGEEAELLAGQGWNEFVAFDVHAMGVQIDSQRRRLRGGRLWDRRSRRRPPRPPYAKGNRQRPGQADARDRQPDGQRQHGGESAGACGGRSRGIGGGGA